MKCSSVVMFASLVLVACGGSVDTPERIGEASSNLASDDSRRVSTPVNAAPCAYDQTSWHAGDNGYNARVLFCRNHNGRLGMSTCNIHTCVETLPAKTCNDTEFVSCWVAIDFMDDKPDAPAACGACF